MIKPQKTTIGIIDYGAGNTRSIRSVIAKLGYRSRLIAAADDIASVDLLLIPGVGAYPSAMDSLASLNGMIDGIRNAAQQGKGIIGICLGMQLLSDMSYEQGNTQGLELIPGKVKPLCITNWHIGWNSLEIVNKEISDINIHDGHNFYFNHSYEFHAPEEYIIGLARIGETEKNNFIISAVRKNNIFGYQFHPEKSQQDGMKLMDSTIRVLINA